MTAFAHEQASIGRLEFGRPPVRCATVPSRTTMSGSRFEREAEGPEEKPAQ